MLLWRNRAMQIGASLLFQAIAAWVAGYDPSRIAFGAHHAFASEFDAKKLVKLRRQ